MSRKSKRVSEAVRPVIENLQPRVLLSSAIPDPGPVAPPEAPLPTWLENVDLNRKVATPADAGPSAGGIVVEGVRAVVYGTDGNDTIVVTPGEAEGEVRVSGVAGVPDGTVIDGIEHLYVVGGNGNDHISVDSGPTVFSEVFGGDGDDVLIATGYAESLVGGNGNDVIRGSAENQRLIGGPGNDTIDGGGGGDTLFVGNYGFVNSYPQSWLAGLLFEAGIPTQKVVVRMDLGTVPDDGLGGQDVIANVRNVLVAYYWDSVIYGNDQDNYIVSDGGPCTIYGGGGNDTIAINRGPTHGLLSGGEGDDTLFTGSADVILDGGPGRNTYEYNIPDGRVETIVLDEPTAPVSGGTDGEEQAASAPAAAVAGPRAQVTPAQAAKKAHLAAKKAAKLKAAKLKARQAKLGRLMKQ